MSDQINIVFTRRTSETGVVYYEMRSTCGKYVSEIWPDMLPTEHEHVRSYFYYIYEKQGIKSKPEAQMESVGYIDPDDGRFVLRMNEFVRRKDG